MLSTNMSKLQFRAKALDATKPMPIFMAEELPDLPDYSAINRAVPQMPSGMEKEEECEHHLQRAICAGLIIPTPEVTDIPQKEYYDKVYPANYKQPRQLIHMQPFAMEQDIPDYDMDSDDERWLQSQTQRLELNPLKFEEMMDRLEKSSGQTVVTLNEAKALLKEDDDLIIAVFDYWLNKRLKTQHPLILSVKTEHRAGQAANNPYIAFRRRTDKMQTRKHRKNDEISYEKMLKLKRDFYRAVTLLELVKRREKAKREHVHLTIEIFEKRFRAKDFSGQIVQEVSSQSVKQVHRPAFQPIFHNHYANQTWANKAILKEESLPRKDKRQYKKRKHKQLGQNRTSTLGSTAELGAISSDEEPTVAVASPEPEENEEEGQFAFRRNKACSYHMPLPEIGNWPWCSIEEKGRAESKYRYSLSSLSHPKRRCIGMARRRMGRGGRVIIDRASTSADDEFWRSLDFTIFENHESIVKSENNSSDRLKMDNETTQFIKSNRKHNSFESTAVAGDLKPAVKEEPLEIAEFGEFPSASGRDMPSVSIEDQEEMLDFLRSVRKDWLHFRPKTPLPNLEPSSESLLEDPYWKLGSNSPFSLEIQSLDPPGTGVLDTSMFVTDPFNLDSLEQFETTPITDTRQHPHIGDRISQTTTGINLNVNVGINTLTPSSVNSSIDSGSSNVNHVEKSVKKLETSVICDDLDSSNDSSLGCSRFHVYNAVSDDASANIFSSLFSSASRSFRDRCTYASPSNRGNGSSVDGQSEVLLNSSSGIGNSNGILPQFGYEVPTASTRANKLSYAYTSGGEVTVTSANSTLNLHTPTLTLNSHSANIFEIPISSSGDAVSGELVNPKCTESSSSPTTNNKNKSIVRKNNLVMEVT